MSETKNTGRAAIIAASIVAAGMIIAALIISTHFNTKDADKKQTGITVIQTPPALQDVNKQTTTDNCDLLNSIIADSKNDFKHFKGKFLKRDKMPAADNEYGDAYATTDNSGYKSTIVEFPEMTLYYIMVYDGSDEEMAQQAFHTIINNTDCIFSKVNYKTYRTMRLYKISEDTEFQVAYSKDDDGSWQTVIMINKHK